MKPFRFLLACLVAAAIACPVTSCSDDTGKEEPIGVVTINGSDLTIAEVGYTVPDGFTIIQIVLDDPDGQNGKSNIELQFPNSYTGDWYTLAQDGTITSSWRIILQNIIVGEGAESGIYDYMIADGSRVLIEQLGEPGKNGKCRYRVAFDIALTDGKTASADIEGELKNAMLWVGGR